MECVSKSSALRSLLNFKLFSAWLNSNVNWDQKIRRTTEVFANFQRKDAHWTSFSVMMVWAEWNSLILIFTNYFKINTLYISYFIGKNLKINHYHTFRLSTTLNPIHYKLVVQSYCYLLVHGPILLGVIIWLGRRP